MIKYLIVFIWWFGLLTSDRVIGPFDTRESCEVARKEAARVYEKRYILSCWEGPR